jgi:hypothetical protein
MALSTYCKIEHLDVIKSPANPTTFSLNCALKTILCKRLSNHIKQGWRHRISLTYPFQTFEKWAHLIVQFNTDSTIKKLFKSRTPKFIKHATSMHVSADGFEFHHQVYNNYFLSCDVGYRSQCARGNHQTMTLHSNLNMYCTYLKVQQPIHFV